MLILENWKNSYFIEGNSTDYQMLTYQMLARQTEK